MDPDETLRELLEDVENWNVNKQPLDADLMAHRIDALHHWIVLGGFLPKAWQR